MFRNIKYIRQVKAPTLTSPNQKAKSSGDVGYTEVQVKDLAEKLEKFRTQELGPDPKQQELLDILITGAEWLLKNETKKEELVLVMEKNFKDATVSALEPFVQRGGKAKREECFSWGRASTVGPK
jgi:hypothetical protein